MDCKLQAERRLQGGLNNQTLTPEAHGVSPIEQDPHKRHTTPSAKKTTHTQPPLHTSTKTAGLNSKRKATVGTKQTRPPTPRKIHKTLGQSKGAEGQGRTHGLLNTPRQWTPWITQLRYKTTTPGEEPDSGQLKKPGAASQYTKNEMT